MEYTRRKFAKLLQAGAVITAAGLDSAAFAGTSAGAAPAAGLTGEFFATLTGSQFQLVSAGDGSRSLTLLSVKRETHRSLNPAKAPDVESAILRFSTDGFVLPDGIYSLRHNVLGKFEMFLSQGAPGFCNAVLAHVPAAYLAGIEIPRRQIKPVFPTAALPAEPERVAADLTS